MAWRIIKETGWAWEYVESLSLERIIRILAQMDGEAAAIRDLKEFNQRK